MAMIAKTGPDLDAVGAAARISKKETATPHELTDFTVKKGDNGGVIVCENYRSHPPEGRRVGAAYPAASDYKENPFGPDDGAKATVYISGLLSDMTGGAMTAESPEEEAAEPAGPAPVPSRPPVAPPRSVAPGPMGGGKPPIY